MNFAHARRFLLLAAACSGLAAALPQDDVLTPWKVSTLQSVRSAEISPDGNHVAYVLSIPRRPWEEDDGLPRTELHVLDCTAGTSRPFITGDSGVGQVRWTPDGSGIAFVAKRGEDEHRGLYVMPFDGGEAQRAFAFDDRGVGTYAFAPDGASVALLATPPVGEEREAEKKKGFNQTYYEEEGRPAELWIAQPFQEDAEPRHLALDGHVSDLVWSPDGARIALAVAPTTLVDDSYMLKRIWIVDVESGAVSGRVENGGKLGRFAWSPAGDGLAIIAGVDVNDGSDARLMWAPTDHSGGGDGVAPVSMLGERERDEDAVAWIGRDRLLVLGSQSAWSLLDTYRVEDGRAVDRESALPLEGPVWRSISVSDDGNRVALVGSTPRHPEELFTLDLRTGELVRRTDSNPWLRDLRLARQEVVRYEARDGLAVEGVLIHPLDASGPAPLIVCVHGGPEAHEPNGWKTWYSRPGQMAAAQGYAVFYPNYRGSTGRGLAYLKSSQGDPAGKEFDDIVDGVDHLVEAGIADRARVGVTGGSYGGYATGWCSTYYSDRFAAGVMFVGISDKISKVGTTDIPNEEFHVHALKRPWDDWMFMLERSPIYYAGQGRTPLLILHGQKDTRVDPGQSRELYRHLKLRGQAPVRLVHYPDEGHGNRKAASRFDYSLRMLRWFDHYLKGAGGEPPAVAIDYEAHLEGQDEEAHPVEAGASQPDSGPR